MQRQYLLPDSSYFYNQRSVSDNINTGHRFNFSLEHRFDSSMSIKISPSFSYQNSSIRSATDYETRSEEQVLTNKGFTLNESSSSGYAFRNDILFMKKFAKKGRTFSMSLQQSLNQSDGDGLQKSINSFYDTNGSLYRTDSIDQSI